MIGLILVTGLTTATSSAEGVTPPDDGLEARLLNREPVDVDRANVIASGYKELAHRYVWQVGGLDYGEKTIEKLEAAIGFPAIRLPGVGFGNGRCEEYAWPWFDYRPEVCDDRWLLTVYTKGNIVVEVRSAWPKTNLIEKDMERVDVGRIAVSVLAEKGIEPEEDAGWAVWSAVVAWYQANYPR
jgi:hypothetical protein